MKLLLWICELLIGMIKPQKVEVLLTKIYPMILDRIPHEQRVTFLQTFLKNNISCSVKDLNRQERASLMNGLLPVIAKEFPLMDLDLLTAFPAGKNPSDQES